MVLCQKLSFVHMYVKVFNSLIIFPINHSTFDLIFIHTITPTPLTKFHKPAATLTPPVLTFTAKTRHATYTETNYPYSICIRKKFHSDGLLKTATNSWEDATLIDTILTFSNLGLTIIFSTYLYKLHFLPPPLTCINLIQ